MSEVSQLEAEDSIRVEARKRIEKRRNLQAGTVAYVVFNAFIAHTRTKKALNTT